MDSPIAQRLKYLRSLTRLSRDRLAKKHNFPEITLRSWETNKVKLSHKGLLRCIELYKKEGIFVTEEWLKNGTGPQPFLTGDVAALNYVNINKEIQSEDENSRILRDSNALKELYPEMFIHYITSDEMLPQYKVGDFVGGIFHYKDFENFHNHDCIIFLEYGKIIFRRVIISDDNHCNLVSINPFTASREAIIFSPKIKGIAPVMFHRKKLTFTK